MKTVKLPDGVYKVTPETTLGTYVIRKREYSKWWDVYLIPPNKPLNHITEDYWCKTCERKNRCLRWVQEMGEANARLIAAAPEMLEALKRAKEFLPGIANRIESFHPGDAQAIDQCIFTLRAVIAKAEGLDE